VFTTREHNKAVCRVAVCSLFQRFKERRVLR
jgi:hypothetical protein